MGEIILDDNEIMGEAPMQALEVEPKKSSTRRAKPQVVKEENDLVSCLRNERIIVRFHPKQSGIVTDPKHILYGGMAEGAVRWFTVPKFRSVC